MIVPMKKVWIAATASDRDRVLSEVAALGVVHIQTQPVAVDSVESARESLRSAELAWGLLEEFVPKKAPKRVEAVREWGSAEVERVLELQRERSDCQQRLAQVRKALEELAFWGNWDPAVLEPFRQAGLYPVLYRRRAARGKDLPPRAVVWRTVGDRDYVLVLQHDPQPSTAMEVVPFPPQGRAELLARLREAESQLAAIEEELRALAARRGGLAILRDRARWRLEWEVSAASGQSGESLVFWTGFVPASDWERLRQAAVRGRYGVMARDPEPGEAVPTLVRNPIVPGMVKPVFDLLGTIPGYWERDISLPFLLYFLVFFSILIGDAGYGLIFLVLGLVMLGRDVFARKTVGEGGLLLTVLAAATVVWGALTGTWFGNLIELADGALRDFLRALTLRPFVLEDYSTNQAFVKFFCFTLGLTQLALGHVWNFFRTLVHDRNPLKSVAELGALTSTLALYPVVLTLVLPAAEVAMLPPELVGWNKGTVWALWPDDLMVNLLAAAAGVGLVVLFGKQEGNFVRGVQDGLSNLLNTALGSVGWFSDNISYIRLFAVGLAGFAIAQSFNTMAAGAASALSALGSVGSILGLAAAAVILLLGHGLNLVMALLGVVVHGVRLNLLEFSGRLGIEWSGFAFKPLRLWQEKNR